MSYSVIGVFAEKGKLVLSDAKTERERREGRPSDTAALCGPRSSERMFKVDAKDSEGFIYSAELKRTGDAVFAK